MVTSVASGRKFYRLPPDKENTVGVVNMYFFCRGIFFFVCWEGRFNHRLLRIRLNSGLSLELPQKGDR